MSLFLESINITNYKNITQSKIVFGDRFNYIIGQNGAGKTNLLDVIYFVAMGKSYSTSQDKLLIQHNEDFFRLESNLVENGTDSIYISSVGLRRAKHIECNGVKYEHLADHLGNIPIVFVTPADGYVLFLASQERRKFLDRTISQSNPIYLRELMQYNKLLKQRNSLLKRGESKGLHELLDTYDMQMAPLAKSICTVRAQAVNYLAPLIASHYKDISEDSEIIEISYQSQLLENDYLTLANENRHRDVVMYRSSTGIHKDDLIVNINGRDIKKYASQGQMKSFVLGLKLAQHQYLLNKLEKKPILLIDDIFAKLDRHRVKSLLQLLSKPCYGQIFITDTSGERMNSVMENLNVGFNCFKVVEGVVSELTDTNI